MVLDQNIRAATAGAAPQLPFGLQFDVFRPVTFFQQTAHAFEHHKILVRFEVARLPLVNDQPSGFRISDFLSAGIDLDDGCADGFAEDRALLVKAQRGQPFRQIFWCQHHFLIRQARWLWLWLMSLALTVTV
jgi:hypothetical protein